MRPQIVFSNVTLDLGGKTILENISLDVKAGEVLCIIGAVGYLLNTSLVVAQRHLFGRAALVRDAA